MNTYISRGAFFLIREKFHPGIMFPESVTSGFCFNSSSCLIVVPDLLHDKFFK